MLVRLIFVKLILNFINLAPSVRLVAFCQWRQGYRDFLFARMESLEVLDQGFKRDPNFDPQEYLSGSQIKGQPIVARLIVDPPVSRWLDQDAPAGVEEKKQFLGGRVCLVVDTEGEKELVRWVLKHGRLVKVIEPERLVIRIKKEDMPRKPIKNGLRQRQQFRRGEHRLRGNELTSYLAMANFEDLTKRLEATENYRQSADTDRLSAETLRATLSVGDSYRKCSESHQCLSSDEYVCRRRYSSSCI